MAGVAGAAVCGDADGDGIVSTRDGVQILKIVAGVGDECATDGCDVDRDGRIATNDGVLALRRAAELPIVDHCGTASISGRLLVPPAIDAAAARSEHEPNDAAGTAERVGLLAPGTLRRLTGTVAPDDPFDGWAFGTGGAVALDLELTFAPTAGVDLDLLVDDRRGGAVTCEGTAPGSERCSVTIAASGVFDVVVAPAHGSAAAVYTLTVRAGAARSAPSGAIAAGAGADHPLDLEPAVYRGDAAAILPGEIVLELAAPAAERAGTAVHRALAFAIDAAGIVEEVTADALAPDGTMLLTLPAVRTEARHGSDDPSGRLAAKRARAVARDDTVRVAAALAASPGIRAARPNTVALPARVPSDPLFPEQWTLDVIDLPAAWDVTIGAAPTIVAVIDTGVRSDHPDLARRLVDGFDFIRDPARANDGDGLDPDPFDAGDRPGTAAGGTYHGTHVAGTIAAATDNGRGVAGVTWRTALMPLRVLGVGGGSVFDVAQAIRYAAGLPNTSGTLPDRPARIINLSLTVPGDDPQLRRAVDAATDAGVLVIAAAGNTNGSSVVSPGAFPNVVNVAATERLGAPARYSNFGATVDLAAPGGDTRADRDADGRNDGVLSTRLPGTDDYARLQGTSMASAHVTGVAALLAGVTGAERVSAAQLREVLLTTADDRGAPGRDDRYGAGLVDAARAVRLLAGAPPPSGPRLALDTPSLRIAADESAPLVPFRNAGSGTLVIGAVTVETEAGIPWLSTTVEHEALRVQVDRAGLDAGDHSGRVRLDSNGGQVELAVVVTVAAGPPEDLGAVTVLLRDAETAAPVARTTTTVADEYRYRFAAVPPGHYVIVATTDRDDDGEICDLGEVCGAYPERLAPTMLTVFGGTLLTARDFGMALTLSPGDTLP